MDTRFLSSSHEMFVDVFLSPSSIQSKRNERWNKDENDIITKKSIYKNEILKLMSTIYVSGDIYSSSTFASFLVLYNVSQPARL